MKTYSILLLICFVFGMEMPPNCLQATEPLKEKTSNTNLHEAVEILKLDNDFKGSLSDAVNKEIEVEGELCFEQFYPPNGAIVPALFHEKHRWFFLSNWNDLWKGKKVRITGKIKIKNYAEFVEDVVKGTPPKAQRIGEIYYLTIRKIELINEEQSK